MIIIKSFREIEFMKIVGDILVCIREYLIFFIKLGVIIYEFDMFVYNFIFENDVILLFKGY